MTGKGPEPDDSQRIREEQEFLDRAAIAAMQSLFEPLSSYCSGNERADFYISALKSSWELAGNMLIQRRKNMVS